MRIHKTYRFKVKDPNPGKVTRLRTFAAGLWRKGLNFCLEMAKQHRPRHRFDLHRHVYEALRRFGLPSHLAEDCRDKAFEAYSSHMQLKRKEGVWRRFPHFDGLPAIRFNIPRSCRLFTRGDQHWVSLTTPAGPICLRVTGKRKALEKVWSSKPAHAELVFKGNQLFLHVAVPIQVPSPRAANRRTFVGVDFNAFGHLIAAVARDAAGKVLGIFLVRAGYFGRKRDRFHHVRRSIQKTAGSRKVKRLKRREENFVTTYLHTVTKRFVEWASRFPDPFVSLENLTDILAKVRSLKRSRELKRKIHSWPFRSGQDMLTYKGFLEGLFVRDLQGAFSSRYCSRCGGRNTRRSGAEFRCLDCGYGLNVHLNGARNMSWRAFCYTQRAAGRAESIRDPSGVKGWGRDPVRPETAERQSGPEAEGNEGMRVSVLNNPLGRHSRASRKPLASVVG